MSNLRITQAETGPGTHFISHLHYWLGLQHQKPNIKVTDDTKIFRSIKDTYDYDELQEDINNLIRWWTGLANAIQCRQMQSCTLEDQMGI